jgi:hypothetical protein
VARALEVKLVQEACHSNLYAAKHVANTVLLELRDLSTFVMRAAEDPGLREKLARRDRMDLQAYLKRLHRSFANPRFKSWYVLDAASDPVGKLLAVFPENPGIVTLEYSGRDYYLGTVRLAREAGGTPVHISRVFLAENDNLSKFAMAAPVRAGTEPRCPHPGSRRGDDHHGRGPGHSPTER